jgi:hypothetical protein
LTNAVGVPHAWGMSLATKSPALLNPATLIVGGLQVAKKLGRAGDALSWLLVKMYSDGHRSKTFRGYLPTEHDVFVATFSKSGTNWLMQIAEQIAWRGNSEFEHIHDVVAWPEFPLRGVAPLRDDSRWRASPTNRRVIKTNAPAQHVPYTEDAVYLTVMRDPKEVLVSAYYFLPGVFGILDVLSFDEWYEKLFVGGPLGAAWVEHTASWWARRDQANVGIFNYRDIKRDLPGHVDRVAALMGVELEGDERDAVVERCAFAWMKAHGTRFDAPRMPLLDPDGRPPMIRQGKTGLSGELLSPARQIEVDEMARAGLAERGSDFPYDAWFE